MALYELVSRIGENAALDKVTGPVGRVAKKLVPAGPVKDVLSGTPFGHPVHPPLTDLPIGCFTAATALDLLGGSRFEDAVDTLLALGIVATVPTASAGLSDWSDTYGSEQRVGLVHAAANVAALGLFTASLAARRSGSRGVGRVLGLAGFTALTAGGYLGGHLSYSRGVGVNNAFYQHEPEDWTAVMDAADLAEGNPAKAEVGDATVLLYRSGGRIYAIGSRCSHAGGPLEEGKIDDANRCVECPWHGSVFQLEDGSVVHGPASVRQTAYDARVQDGRVEVRRRPR
jgi:nitrite reductase/ring-hydroxylating ferredoxin subunit/uncharacterized membrane protein